MTFQAQYWLQGIDETSAFIAKLAALSAEVVANSRDGASPPEPKSPSLTAEDVDTIGGSYNSDLSDEVLLN